jgi:Ca2+-binding RTX toxin-like protein
MAENAPLAGEPNATNIGMELDSKGRPFIGYGFDLFTYKNNPTQALAILEAAGAVVVDADQFTILIQGMTAPLGLGELELFSATVYLPNQASAVALLNSSIAAAESGLSDFLQSTLGVANVPQSNERAALIDLYYNGGSGPGGYFRLPNGDLSNLSLALQSGNRAEAWFEIRYRSAANGGGAVTRRYVDSQLFGLYANPDQPTEAEALQAYQMLTQNRSLIMEYELENGSDPYGSEALTPSKNIAAANQNYDLTGTANQVQTLVEAFDPAAEEEISVLKEQYGSVLPDIEINDTGGSGSGFGVRSVDFYAASVTDPDVDAMVSYAPSVAEALAEGVANHILLGSETGDTLVGGLGSDILIAEGGNEWLESGAGADTLIANAGNDTIQAQGISDVMDFVFPTGSSGHDETVEMNDDHSGLGALYVNGSQIGGTLSPAGQEDTWTDQGGNTYKFVAHPTNPPPGYSPGTGGQDVGELQILVGGGQQGGNEIDIWGFNLSEAESAAGYLGIDISLGITVVGGSTDGIDPPVADFIAGTAQSYTVSVSAPSASAQIVTMTLSGAPSSDFGLLSGTTVVPLNSDGSFTVTIPAGQTCASFSLANTGDVGTGATLQLTASMPSPEGQNSISSGALTQNYVEPAQDPFQSPAVPQLYYYGTAPVNGVSVGEYRDVQDESGDSPVASIADGNAFINLFGEGGESINGGAGSDTITGAFVTPANVNGGVGQVSVINLNGAQDIVALEDVLNVDQEPPVAIYGNSAEDLTQAVADAEGGPATHQQGDLISTTMDDSTIVGGNGDDLIISASNGVIVAGSGDDTIVGGASLNWTSGIQGVTWSASVTGNQLTLGGGVTFQTSASSYSYPNYEGNFDSSGYALGTADETIFGGAGNDVVLLSNGNNVVALGSGDSTIFGGMGSNTISGGTGSDSIVGGGGSDYIEAGNGDDFVAGFGGDNTIIGGSGTDTIFAGSYDSYWATEETGSNYVQAGSGNSAIYGSGGADTLLGGSGSDTIYAGDGNESVAAGSGDTSINGGNGADTIVAGSGSDTIWGSTQSTTIYGGSGTDQISGTSGTDVIYAGDGGTSGAPTTVIAGSGDTTVYGGAGVDQISGGGGNDIIYAGEGGTSGAPTQVVAGSGDTTIYGGDGIDNIVGGSGTDVLYAGDGGEDGSPTYVTAGTGAATLYGGAGASVLIDNGSGSDLLEAANGDSTVVGVGQDTLVAGSGSDYLVGGSGTTYVLGPNDSVDEVASSGGGKLEFTSSVDMSDLSLSAVLDGSGAGSLEIDGGDGSVILDQGLSGGGVSSVDFDDPGSLSLTQFIQQEASLGNVTTSTLASTNGNFIFDVVTGDSLSGGSGLDTISAWGNDDTLSAGPGGTDILAAGTDDLVAGGFGNDTLDATGAETTLVGGTGNEVFDVNDPTEVVVCEADAASNQIYSSVSYTLPTNGDVLTLTGTGDLRATGNSDAGNLITGNSGSDTLVAGSGSDTLASGSGVDTLIGGDGPDTFLVNNASDVVEPATSQGWHDTVESSVSFELTASVETLDLVGSAGLSVRADYSGTEITGNAGNDTLIGESGFDTFVGGIGVDTFEAGGDNNTFVVNSINDVIQLDSGDNDTVETSMSYTLGQGVDALTLTGAGDLEGQGNADATNLIEGNSGNDSLIAGSGSDTLVAGSGSDTLVAGTGTGTGTDVLEGGIGATTYLFDADFGQTEIEPGSGSGTIEFETGITPSDLTVGLTTDSNGNPALLIQDGSSAMTVSGGLEGSIGSFEFAGGAELTLAELLTAATAIPGSLVGANGSVVLNSTAAASLSGGYGDDTVLGTGASDTLTGGTGDQYLLGAGDADSITGGFGNDTLVGGGANDTLVAGSGSQVLYALGTADVLSGGTGSDTLYGGAGNDTLVSGTGSTAIYGGSAGDTIVLTQGANATFYPGSTSGTELIELPNQMTLADFTSYQGTDGDLILQSLTGSTAVVIKGFYSGSVNGKTWLIADSTGAVQLLSNWVDSNSQVPSDYQSETQELQQAYAADLPGILNQVGEQGGTIANPGSVISQTPENEYSFDGVTTDNVTVQGGALDLGSSEDIQSTYMNLQTGSTTYSETIPIYSEVTTLGSRTFVADSSLDSLDQVNMQNAVGSSDGFSVEPGTDSNGNAGYWVTTLPSTENEQTGTRTVVETVPTYTAYEQETEGFTAYNVTGDGGNDVITAQGPFVGTVVTGNGNVSVDLGMDNGPFEYSYPNEPALGAFIEAGNGNDSIMGSGGTDTITAGTGYDYISANYGSTVYVPLQGSSTEEIDIQPPFYGRGPLPHSTLVLPTGITPDDLSYRLINHGPVAVNGVDENAETLQIAYGNSTVLIDFTAGPPPNTGNLQNMPSDDWNGIDQFQFSDGTVLTRDQILAMAGSAISASGFNPTVTALNPTVSADSSIAGDALFSGSDSSGQGITWYQVSNAGTGGGYFTLNGVAQAPGQMFYVSAEQLPQLTYVAGASGTSDDIQVSAFDGLVWGNSASFNVNPSAAAISQATGANQEVSGPSSGPDTIIGGYGGDTLAGSSGQDTFEYSSGGGAEVISETASTTATSDDILQFGPGIAESSLSLDAAAGSELVLSIGSGGDSVAIEGFDALNPLQSFPLQSFAFSDGTDLTLLQLLSDSAVTGTSGSITNADGTTTNYQFTPSSGQIYSAQQVNSAGQWLETVSVNADGSDTTSSYTYNADGSETETELMTPAGGGGSTSEVLGINSQGQIVSADIANPDGSTDDATSTYNADGSQIQTVVETPAGGGAPTTIVYDINSQWQTTAMDITNPDGSTSDRAYVYNADGSQTETDVETPAGGGGSTTTVYDINTQGQRTSVDITNPDGSTDDSSYVFNTDGSVTQTEVVTPSGGGGSTTTVYQINSQNQWTSKDVINPDGSTDDTTYTYNADGSQTDTEVQTPAGGGTVTTIVANYSADDTLLNDNSYALSSDGSYTDNWNSDVNGSHGSYWWNASSSEYQESWYDSDGSSWTDQYQYASGGSPATTGYSFTETYEASDGSEGSRQYDASTGAVTLSWDSASTGQLNGTTTDSGFYGLEDESELTNTQPDLTFFNPSASPNFNAFLNAH